MLKKKKQALTTRQNVTTAKIKRLAKKALKNKPKWKPAKGYKYLKDLKLGSLFETQGGTRGVLIDNSISAKVIVTDVKCAEEDRDYYLGKHIFAAHTEVKEIT